VAAVKQASGIDFPVIESPRRAGDPPALISNPARIRATMRWEPAHDDIEGIALSAYNWEKRL
jgi:UDP-glucose 4-epimerase